MKLSVSFLAMVLALGIVGGCAHNEETAVTEAPTGTCNMAMFDPNARKGIRKTASASSPCASAVQKMQ